MGTLDNFKRVNVIMGVPSLMDLWHERFCMSMLAMINHFNKVPLGNYREQSIRPVSVRGSILPNLRLDLVQHARDSKASHLLFIDTDQTYPKDTLHRMIKADKDVVACNIATKVIPSQPTARLYDPANLSSGKRVYNTPGKGLEKIWRVGCGVMLIRMKIFDRLGDDVWGNEFKPSARRYQGEDWAFCEACERAHIDVWIDHDLSEEVKHWGLYGYDHGVVGEVQERVA